MSQESKNNHEKKQEKKQFTPAFGIPMPNYGVKDTKSLDEFIEDYELGAKINAMQEETMIAYLGFALQGRLRTKYRAVLRSIDTWSKAKNWIKNQEKEDKNEEKNISTLIEMKQGEEEDIMDFVTKFQ